MTRRPAATRKRQRTQRARDTLVLVGTTKGAFVLRATAARATWKVNDPALKGHAVYALAFDGRAGRRRILAGAASSHFGALVRASDDLGRHFDDPAEANVKFPAGSGLALRQIWQLLPGRPDEPDVVWAGVEPACLFVSRDAGRTFAPIEGLLDHPHRPRWTPGFGGLCLHTILPHPTDPRRILVAISTGGVYRTDDGGASWHPSNRGIRAEFLPDKHPEFGQCVHKVVQHPALPERYFLQNHWGLYRSDDGGRSWRDVAHGVPSDFGFAMAAHPHDPDTVYIVPLESDTFRCTPEARLRVYRSTDAGRSWKPLVRGLPQKGAYETVLRDALATDGHTPAGVYFGTRSGKLYASRDGGDSWRLLADGLPPILCVKAASLPA